MHLHARPANQKLAFPPRFLPYSWGLGRPGQVASSPASRHREGGKTINWFGRPRLVLGAAERVSRTAFGAAHNACAKRSVIHFYTSPLAGAPNSWLRTSRLLCADAAQSIGTSSWSPAATAELSLGMRHSPRTGVLNIAEEVHATFVPTSKAP